MVDKPVVACTPRMGDEDPGGPESYSWVRNQGEPTHPAPPPRSPAIILPTSLPSLPPRRHVAPPGAAGELRSLLARAVEAEVVPRLVLAHQACADGVPAGPDGPVPGPEDVVALVALALTSDVPTTVAFIDTLRARGVAMERLYLELLAPAARRIGQLWVEDLCSFADVTLALGRLQLVLRELSPAFVPRAGAPRDRRRRAALVAMPGEQHTFGLSVVAEFFLRAGWEVWSEPAPSGAQLAEVVRAQWFAVVGLSVSCDAAVERLPGVIRSVRRASRNPGLGVMVGGRVFFDHPELAAQVGADATATDGRQAALQAETLLALLAGRAESR